MDEIGIVPAREKDLDLVLGILSDAAEWLASKGLSTQWGPGVLSGEKIRDQTRHGEVFLAKLGEETVGTVTLQWSDQIFWKEAPSDAGYVHKLVVRRTYAGRGHRPRNARMGCHPGFRRLQEVPTLGLLSRQQEDT